MIPYILLIASNVALGILVVTLKSHLHVIEEALLNLQKEINNGKILSPSKPAIEKAEVSTAKTVRPIPVERKRKISQGQKAAWAKRKEGAKFASTPSFDSQQLTHAVG